MYCHLDAEMAYATALKRVLPGVENVSFVQSFNKKFHRDNLQRSSTYALRSLPKEFINFLALWWLWLFGH